MKRKKGQKTLAEPRIHRLTSLKDLGDIYSRKIVVQVPMGAEVVEFQCDRLMEKDTAEISKILQRCLPPMVTRKKENGEDERFYNIEDPGWIERREHARRQARALTVWLSWPPIREGVTDSPSLDEVLKIVGEKLPESTIQAIAGQVTGGEVQTEEVVHFLSKAGFPLN